MPIALTKSLRDHKSCKSETLISFRLKNARDRMKLKYSSSSLLSLSLSSIRTNWVPIFHSKPARNSVISMNLWLYYPSYFTELLSQIPCTRQLSLFIIQVQKQWCIANVQKGFFVCLCGHFVPGVCCLKLPPPLPPSPPHTHHRQSLLNCSSETKKYIELTDYRCFF